MKHDLFFWVRNLARLESRSSKNSLEAPKGREKVFSGVRPGSLMTKNQLGDDPVHLFEREKSGRLKTKMWAKK